MRTIYEVIKRPVISEKGAALAEVAGKYVFEVASDANKLEIKQAIQQLFNVKVKKIHTAIMQGKTKRFARSIVKRPNWKKAMVTLQEGQKIEFFQK